LRRIVARNVEMKTSRQTFQRRRVDLLLSYYKYLKKNYDNS
jgi:hypothetical protein